MVLRSSNIVNGKIDLADLVKVKSDIRKNQYLQNGDILICARNGSKRLVGKCALFLGIKEPASFGAFMAVYRSDYNRYIYYFLCTDIFRNTFASDDSKQINQLTQDMIKNTLLPLPPLNEQNRIVKSLNNAFIVVDKIEESKTNLKEDIQKTKSKILDLAIRGKLVPQDPNDEPASVLLERIRAEKEELIKQGKIKRDKKESVIFKGDDNSYYEKIGNDVTCIDNEIPFEIPDNWCWARLSQLSSQIFAGGDKPKIFSKEYTEKCTVPIYSNGIENNGLYGYTDLPRVTEKSLTISARGTIGFACVRNEPFVPIIRLLTIVPATGVYAEYIKCVFQYFLESGKGSSIPQLTVPEIKPKLIPVPPGKEQSKIVKRIDIVFSILNTLEPNSA